MGCCAVWIYFGIPELLQTCMNRPGLSGGGHELSLGAGGGEWVGGCRMPERSLNSCDCYVLETYSWAVNVHCAISNTTAPCNVLLRGNDSK